MSNLGCRDQPILNLSGLNIIPDYLNFLLYEPWEWIVYQCILPLLIIFGLISNVLFLYTVMQTPSLRTTTYMYLINLSIADILTLLFYGIPVMANYHLSLVKGNEIPALYYIRQTGTFIFISTSINFVTLVSFERFLAICYPIRHHMMKGNQRTIKLVIITWAISSLSVLQILFYKSKAFCIIWPKLTSTDNFPEVLTFFNLDHSVYYVLFLIVWCLIQYSQKYICMSNYTLL